MYCTLIQEAHVVRPSVVYAI